MCKPHMNKQLKTFMEFFLGENSICIGGGSMNTEEIAADDCLGEDLLDELDGNWLKKSYHSADN